MSMIRLRLLSISFVVASLVCASGAALAGNTGTVSGTVIDESKTPLAGVQVGVASPTGRGSAKTDARGFYQIFDLPPDTYTISIVREGYEPQSIAGANVFQDQTTVADVTLAKSLKTISRVTTRGASSLLQPKQTADVYNVSAAQLTAAAGEGGHRTLYEVIQTVPGVTSTGYSGRTRIRGGNVGDVAWELDGIPINDRLTGLFTTNLSIVGTKTIEVYTGGYSAQYGNAAQGVINSVIKRGTYPGFGAVRATIQGKLFEHDLQIEYGGATPDNRFSYYVGYDGSNSDTQFADGSFSLFSPLTATNGSSSDAGRIPTKDFIGNFHYKPNQRDDIQFLWQLGDQRISWDQGLNDNVLGVGLCRGVVVQPGTRQVINGGISSTGKPCVGTFQTFDSKGKPIVDASMKPVTITAPTGLQYTQQTKTSANVWYHYSGLGKLQWNHVFNDKLFGQFRLAENFNDYVFDQPYETANFNGALNPGDPIGMGQIIGSAAYRTIGRGVQDDYERRRSHMYFAQADLTFSPTSRSTYYGGLSYERDASRQFYYDLCGCAEAVASVSIGNKLYGSPFNVDGSWPNLFLAVDYPLILPSAYAGTRQTFGKLTVEPSLRWDYEQYDIPKGAPGSFAGGAFGVNSVSPRFAFSYAPNSQATLRGSYGVTSTFVPAAYVFNNSPNGIFEQGGRAISPYYPGSVIAPEQDHNVDLSYARALRDGVSSLRISPFYHKSNNKLIRIANVITNADGTVSTNGPPQFKTGVITQNLGVEFGFNHVVRGDGLSYYVAGTWQNYWGSLSSSILNSSTPFGLPIDLTAFINNHSLYRNSSQPPLSMSFTADYNHARYHIRPFFVYEVGAPYNVLTNQKLFPGLPASDPRSTLVDSAIHNAGAFWYGNLDLGYDLSRNGANVTTIGVNIRNLTANRTADIAPSPNRSYPNSGDTGAAATYGPGVLPNTLYYTPPSGSARLYQLYLSTKF